MPVRRVLRVHIDRHPELLAAHRVCLDDLRIVQAAAAACAVLRCALLQTLRKARIHSRRSRGGGCMGGRADVQRRVRQGLHHLGVGARLLRAAQRGVGVLAVLRPAALSILTAAGGVTVCAMRGELRQHKLDPGRSDTA